MKKTALNCVIPINENETFSDLADKLIIIAKIIKTGVRNGEFKNRYMAFEGREEKHIQARIDYSNKYCAGGYNIITSQNIGIFQTTYSIGADICKGIFQDEVISDFVDKGEAFE